MDTGPGRNGAYMLSMNRGTKPMAGNTVDLAEAFACAGGSFRMLLPVLLMSVRDGDPVSFRQLSKFADILVPERRCKSTLSPIATSNTTDIGPSI